MISLVDLWCLKTLICSAASLILFIVTGSCSSGVVSLAAEKCQLGSSEMAECLDSHEVSLANLSDRENWPKEFSPRSQERLTGVMSRLDTSSISMSILILPIIRPLLTRPMFWWIGPSIIDFTEISIELRSFFLLDTWISSLSRFILDNVDSYLVEREPGKVRESSETWTSFKVKEKDLSLNEIEAELSFKDVFSSEIFTLEIFIVKVRVGMSSYSSSMSSIAWDSSFFSFETHLPIFLRAWILLSFSDLFERRKVLGCEGWN